MSASAALKLHRPQPLMEPWLGRMLSWIYPGRGWGGAQWMAEQESGISRAKATSPTPVRAAGFRTGGTK
jgi:hypothetical protein